MPIRYTATADGAGMAKMLAPVDGSFGYVHGVLTQTAAGEPVEWKYPGRSPAPYAIVGENTWRDYTVSARVILPASARGSPPPGALLIARFQGFLVFRSYAAAACQAARTAVICRGSG
jgi:hypothetical protein